MSQTAGILIDHICFPPRRQLFMTSRGTVRPLRALVLPSATSCGCLAGPRQAVTTTRISLLAQVRSCR
jgi:hypothetical protein